MHKYFPDWYRIVTVQLDGGMLIKRWAAVEAIATWTKRRDLLDLVRLVRGELPADAVIRGKVIEASRAVDAAFSARDSDAELRVLAGAALAKIVQTSSYEADLVSLALVAVSFQGTVGDELLKEFGQLANQYISDESIRLRTPDERSSQLTTADTAANLATFRSAVAAATTPAAIAEPTAELVGALTAALTNMITGQARQFYREIDALREESNMFWWVFSGYSRDLQRSFGDIGLGASCLIAAKELADLTVQYPGPRVAPALLDRVLAGIGKKPPATINFAEAVCAPPPEWRRCWLVDYPSTDVLELAPLMFAVKRSLETDSATDWLSSFTKATGVQSRLVAPPVLANQAYTESLLVRAAAKVEA